MFRILSPFLLGALVVTGALQAADQNSPETKLRETLRNTMLQLRTAEADREALKAAQEQNEQEKKTLGENLEKLTKQSSTDKDASDKIITNLKAQDAEKDKLIADLKESLDKWKAAYNQVADVARSKESERAKLAGEKIVLERKVAIRETKNAAMFKLGNEILTRYEKFGLGTALTAREPFIGTTRVKLENLVQDYSDKLSDQTIKPNTDQDAQPAAEPATKPSTEKPSAEKAKPAAGQRKKS
jgi:hypothetical protein